MRGSTDSASGLWNGRSQCRPDIIAIEHFDIVNFLVHNIENQHTPVGAKRDISMSGTIASGRLWGGVKASAEIVFAAASVHNLKARDFIRQIALSRL
jgi:hypothetical protein